MAEEIFIEKKLCSWENGNYYDNIYYKRLKVRMPAGKYEGYHILHKATLSHEDKNYFSVYYYENTIFELIKTEREPGVRYKRPKLGVEEFKELFKEIDDKLHRRTNMWLAQMPVYDYKWAGRRPVRFDYFVGSLEDKWFYISPEEKKLIGADTFKLVKPMTDREIEEFNKYQKLHNKTTRALREVIEYIGKFQDIAKYRFDERSENIKNAETEFNKACEAERLSLEKQLNELDAAFLISIEAVPEEAIQKITETNIKKEKEIKFIDIDPLEIIKITDKAVQVIVRYEDINHEEEVWLPKSRVKISEDEKTVISVASRYKRRISA